MQYLVKEFGANEHYGYAIHLVTDDGTELKTDSLWRWIRQAKRDNTEIAVYRVVNAVALGDQNIDRDVLAIHENGKMEFRWGWNRLASDAAKLAEPSTMFYNLECVLDLS